MTEPVRDLLDRALRLPVDEREALAAALLNSLDAECDPRILELDGRDSPETVAKEWQDELARRAATAETDPVVDWETLREQIRKTPRSRGRRKA